jgi:two-component system, NarL family, sensor kinase
MTAPVDPNAPGRAASALDVGSDASPDGSNPPTGSLPVPPAEPPWVILTSPESRRSTALDRPISLTRVIVQVVAVAAAVVAIVALIGSYASRSLAEREAVHDAAKMTDAVAEGLVQPALTPGLLTGDKAAAAELHKVLDPYQLPKALLSRTDNNNVVRIKLWRSNGQVVFSDNPGLEGRVFEMDSAAREVLEKPATKAEVTDLSKPENQLEELPHNTRLLEVYRPVWVPGTGDPMLLEIYYKYDAVAGRSSEIWRGFAGITLSSLAALLVLMLPLLWALLDRTRRAQQQREDYMQRALDASQEERRRIAAALHDGVVQELTAVSFLVAGSAEEAASSGRTAQASRLRDAAATVRNSMGSLRSLLVEIYPPNLRAAGLAAALSDLAATAAGRDVAVTLEVDDDVEDALGADGEEAVYRIAQECLRNVTRHSRAGQVTMTVTRDGSDVRLLVADDGDGFADPSLLRTPPEGHFGLRLMQDVAANVGGTLRVSTAPGQGTRWLFEVPAVR